MQHIELSSVASLLWYGILIFLFWLFFKTTRIEKALKTGPWIDKISPPVMKKHLDYIMIIVFLVETIIVLGVLAPSYWSTLVLGLDPPALDLVFLFTYAIILVAGVFIFLVLLQMKSGMVSNAVRQIEETFDVE